MKLFCACVVLLLCSVLPASAQAVHANNSFAWTMQTDQASAQALVYIPKEGSTSLAALTGVTCTGATAPVNCTAKIGTRTPGSHTYVLVAVDTNTLTPLESPASNAVTFTFRGSPNAPASFGVAP